jgi:hypothetical protein
MSCLGHLQSFNMSRLGHLQSSLSRPSDWKTITGRCISMLIQNIASVVVFELHRTCSRSLSSCIGHGFPLIELLQMGDINQHQKICLTPVDAQGNLVRMKPKDWNEIKNNKFIIING